MFLSGQLEELQNRLVADRRLMAVFTGLALGASAAILGLLTVIGGPLVPFAVLFGLAAGLYVLTDLMASLYVTFAIIALLPFGGLPLKVALTPTFLDLGLGSFMLVYIFQWMTGRRSDFRIVPAQWLILAFALYTIFCFVAGLSNGTLTTTILRRFLELILSMVFAVILIDVTRDVETLRRIALVIIVFGTIQALAGIILTLISDATAERLLNTLGRFGYPQGGVVRYIDDNPDLAERAIGTWVDPNAYGGFLLMVGALAGSQILAERPVTRNRWLALATFGIIALATWLTQSRGALIALACAGLFIAALRYRWLLVVILVLSAVLVFLPFTQDYINRFVEGLTGQDISTQMRLGEYKDALLLIGRYPIIGVGFAGTPDRDIYLAVSSVYLKVAGGTGLVGLALYLLTIAETFRYGLRRWSRLLTMPELSNVWLGFAAGLAAAVVGGIFDHYYFNIEFHASGMMFWGFMALSLAAAHLVDTMEKPTHVEAAPSDGKLEARELVPNK